MSTTFFVIDSSVIVKWLSSHQEKYLEQADKLLEDAHDKKVELIVPELAKYEIGNVLLFSKKLSPEQANFSLLQFFNLPITYVTESEELAKETYLQAYTNKITYYDAAFLSLAKYYNAKLVTDNIKHQGRSSDIKTIALKDY